MKIGMIGMGRMGANMTLRLLRAGHEVVAYDRTAAALQNVRAQGAKGVTTLEDLAAELDALRAVWAMIPAGQPVDDLLDHLHSLLDPGDLFIDGGNSNYKDSRRRHAMLKESGIDFVDAGVSGGIWGLEKGFCMMLGGEPGAITRLEPALDSLAPPEGWLHVGPSGAGHYAKMIHNGIEYGLMQSYAEGFEILAAGEYKYDLAKLSHLWNQGSVVRSWLLELAERAFAKDPGLEHIRGWVEDSGEGRWTVTEAIDRGVPAEVLASSLFARFRSRQDNSFRDRVLAALRQEFGGHAVKER